MAQPVIDWLLKGDASIRWQVQRDLLDAKPEAYEKERARTASTGWGKRLLSKQGRDGNWGGGIYSPKWISTTYTLLLLRDLGLPHENAQAQRACCNFFLRGLERDGGVNLFKSIRYSEQCTNGMLLSLLAYFRSSDERVQNIAEFLLRQQMPDGGWNCESVHGATHGSFHTTVSVLEGSGSTVSTEAALHESQLRCSGHTSSCSNTGYTNPIARAPWPMRR